MWYLVKTLPIDVWASRRSFFLLKPLENAFFECLHTTYIERTHMGTLYYESGHENENKPRSGQVAWGHRNMRLCPKIHQQYLLSWPFTFSIYVNTNQCQKYHQNDGNMINLLLASKIGILPILQECPYGLKKLHPHKLHIFGKPWTCPFTWCHPGWVIVFEKFEKRAF